jgi:hypothetical protein
VAHGESQVVKQLSDADARGEMLKLRCRFSL